jgi:lipopolysaccharide transport system permease protein
LGSITDVSSAVVYPMALVKKNAGLCLVVQYNPLAYIIETTRYMLLNVGHISHGDWVTPLGDCCLVISGVLIFNRTEKSFY